MSHCGRKPDQRAASRLGWIGIILLIGLYGCAQPTAIETPTLPPTATLTPTATRIWFPATATATITPLSSLEPTAEQLPEVGQLILSDDFSDITLWQTVQSKQGSVAYGINELSLAIPGVENSLLSLRTDLELSDFYLEIDVDPTLCRGKDNFGLLLRAQSLQDYYRWIITCESELRLERIDNGKSVVLVNWIPGIIQPGLTHLAVWASGREMRFYINGTSQFTVSDRIFSTGSVGVFARSEGENALTVSFSNLKIYATVPEDRIVSTPTSTPTPKR